MKAGRVITGFSKPYVAKYSAIGTTVSYTGGMVLARGVSINLSPESSEDNKFYADNQVAESDSGVFTGGSAEIVVDGMNPTAERFVRGLPAAGLDGWTEDGDSAQAPYLGVGYIVRYRSDGKNIFVPTVLAKTQISVPEQEAQTQEDEVSWQTQTLTATLMRADDANHNWRFIGKDYDTEAEAEEALCEKLGMSSPSYDED